MSESSEHITIVTHSGGFHADDVFAVALLKKIHEGRGNTVTVLRSRDPEVWKTGTYVVDVGGEYDPPRGRFDHHQAGGAGVRENGIPYSSFGLVWKEFGQGVCASAAVCAEVEQVLVMPIDAHDSGISLTRALWEDIFPITLSGLVHFFGPTWEESNDDSLLRGFMEAVVFAETLIDRVVKNTHAEQKGVTLVHQAIVQRTNPHLLVLDVHAPWESAVATVPDIFFVVYPHPSGTWSVKTARESLDSFASRKLLPETWAGKTDVVLQQETGVVDATFCHNARFTCGAKTKEGAIALAEKALLA